MLPLAKVVLPGNSVAYIRGKKSQVSNLSSYLKNLEKEQNMPKSSRRKEIIKSRKKKKGGRV